MFRKYSSELIIAIATLAIAAAWLPIRMRFPFDDTYITFRYAANLAHGFGIVWNPGGAHTEGYTNFLFMLMLVPFSWMGWDLIIVSQAIGVVAVVVSAIAIYRIVAQTLVCDPAADESQTKVCATFCATVAVALFLLDPFTWFNAYSGMETSLFTMWLLLVVLSAKCLVLSKENNTSALSTKHLALSFLFATLAALTRPEGAIMGAILLVVGLISMKENKRAVLRQFRLVFVWPLVLFAAWKLYYFGNLLPNSFYIKVAQASSGTFLPGRGTMRIFYEGVWYLLPFAIFAGWKYRKNVTVQIAALWCILLSGFYLFSQLIQPQYGRFTNSIEVMLIVLAAIGVSSLKNVKPIIVLIAACSLVILSCLWSVYFRSGIGYMTQDTNYTDRYRRLAEVFRSIPDHEEITLASSDAGILPYYSGMKHLDVVGLNTTAIAHSKTPDEVVSVILGARPDIIFVPLNASSFRNDRSYVFTGGHGLIGSAYPLLSSKAISSGYKSVAIIPMFVYDLDMLTDTLSPHYRDIVNTIVPRIGHDPDFASPARSIK